MACFVSQIIIVQSRHGGAENRYHTVDYPEKLFLEQ